MTLQEVAGCARMIGANVIPDLNRTDQTPFTPDGVGALLGEHRAMIGVLANLIIALADRLMAIEAAAVTL